MLIISYETFRLHSERFSGDHACDLLICDEAHRLKSDQTLTSKARASSCTHCLLLQAACMSLVADHPRSRLTSVCVACHVRVLIVS